MTTYFGKYRGSVTNNIDPEARGRLMVQVPSVLGSGSLNWAEPCVPYAGKGLGFLFLPPNGANVWVEFEAGDSQRPIWTGCFWGPGEAAPLLSVPEHKILKTDGFELSIFEVQGAPGAKVEIKVAPNNKISMDPTQIIITNGASTITLMGPSVKINNGALEVT